jgi:alcohol dehydrogenase class IV
MTDPCIQIDNLLDEFKMGTYLYGPGCLAELGGKTVQFGKAAMLVRIDFPGIESLVERLKTSLSDSGIEIIRELVNPIRPNAPVEDMMGVSKEITLAKPDMVISFGGGSTIDAVKSSIVLDSLGGDIEDYFGVGKVADALTRAGKTLTPHIAIQTAASSAAHLTKYSNITNLATGQKKLIVDEVIVPQVPVFDYEVTYDTPRDLTLDGALDGMAHCLEVYFGSVNKPNYDLAEEIALLSIGLIVKYLPRIIKDPGDREARHLICAATDLGGYAIMIGGTSGAHLTSFSLVDVLSHGRACALMNPYYAVYYAPAIEKPLRELGRIYLQAGYTDADFSRLSGNKLGIEYANAMFAFARHINFPTKLGDVDGFSEEHIKRALTAAKNPQLKSKLENMPVPMNPDNVDEYMGSILRAAQSGNLSMIKNVT